MREIHLDDETYDKAKHLAAARGFASIEEYFVDVIELESSEEAENYDRLFTPEVLAAARKGLEDIEAGRSYAPEEVLEHMAEWAKECQKDRAS